LSSIPLRKLDELAPKPEQLDRFERASTDELRAWQRQRLAWTLRHAYDNVPHYRKAFDAAGVHP
jgi:phenylacetate-CoA ligase